jgi:molybdate transport system substrate-binding protein
MSVRRGCPLAAALALVALLGLAACGAADGSSSARATTAPLAAPRLRGDLTVFAAASLTAPFDDLRAALLATAPELHLTVSFGGSGALVAQIQQGAPADVVATADVATMQTLRDAGLVEQPTTFAHNRLEILVAQGNPKHISGLADLGRSDVTLVLGDTTVPAGRYAAQVLGRAGVTVHPVSLEPSVTAAVAKVTSGEADVTIAYVTDVAATGSRGEGVAIPKEENVVADYPIAIVTGTPHHEAAAAFIGSVVTGEGQRVLRARGFLAA